MFNIDADLNNVDSGVWANFEGSKFLVAHISNMKFQRAISRLQQPHRRKIESGQLDPKTNRDIVCEALSEAVLLDWQEVINKDKEPIPYTSKTAFVALSKNPEFRDFISEFATNLSNYRSEEVEALGEDSSIG